MNGFVRAAAAGGRTALVGAALALMIVPLAGSSHAAEFSVQPVIVDDLKSVFGRVESRTVLAARARIGGSVVSIDVTEGDAVRAGQVIATIGDDKLKLRLDAVNATVRSLSAQRDNAQAELDRGETLFSGGIIAKARIDQLRTQLDVLKGELAAATAERALVVQQAREGQVLAPAAGRVLSVPITPNSVLLPGETIATIAGDGYYLRIALPERHAVHLMHGDPVLVGERGIGAAEAPEGRAPRTGKLVKIYPELSNGFVLADIAVDGLGDFFVGERVLVWVPVERRRILAVPPAALTTRHGIDYVRVANDNRALEVAVVPGRRYDTPDGPRIEILSGLAAGDRIIVP